MNKKRISIDATDRSQARAIEAGLAIPEVRAFVLTMGLLSALPTDQSRARVLRYVADRLGEADSLVAKSSAAFAHRGA